MTPYTERRMKGYYNPKGEKPQSTTSGNLVGGSTSTAKGNVKITKDEPKK